jgi:transcriptional regulator with XRE-family HTH domain
MTFAPPATAQNSIVRPEGEWISCGWLALDTWMSSNGKRYKEVADSLGCSTATITAWKNGRPPAGIHLERIVALAAIEKDAWQWWVSGESRADAPPPSSKKQPVAPREFAGTREELLATIQEIDVALRGDLGEGARANLLGKRTSALLGLSRIEQGGSLEQHPEFEAHKGDIRAALRDTFAELGVDAPVGFRAFAAAVVRQENSRTRRAA